jgi:hypothetical protein
MKQLIYLRDTTMFAQEFSPSTATFAKRVGLPVLSRQTLSANAELLRSTCEHTGFFYLVSRQQRFVWVSWSLES